MIKGIFYRVLILVFVAVLTLIFTVGVCFAGDLSQKAKLGKRLFFDENLSTPPGMSCAMCHDPKTGFADLRRFYPTSHGVIPKLVDTMA